MKQRANFRTRSPQPPSRRILSILVAQSLSLTAAQAATVQVTSTADNGTGCTLREAVASINNGSEQGGCSNISGNGFGVDDQVAFDASVIGGTISLTSGTQIVISNNVAINPAGDTVTIDGNNSRIFYVNTDSLDISLDNLVLTGANVIGQPGGAIFVDADSSLTLTDTTVTGNSADFGGGISSKDATLILSGSTISGNSADVGGGVRISEGETTITDSMVSANTASARAGGIYANLTLTTVNLVNTTISGNSANTDAGINVTGASVMLTNSTVSGNSAEDEGGGIAVRNDGTLTLLNSTIAGNTAGTGAGIYDNASLTTITLVNSIVAGAQGGGRDCEYNALGAPNMTVGNDNIIEDDGCATSALYSDPALGALADNGGATLTHALTSTSSAIDPITANNGACPPADQRGAARDDGACDLGAFEIKRSMEVTSTLDDATGCTLREAVISVNNGALEAGCSHTDVVYGPADEVRFGASVSGDTVSLTNGQIEIDQNIFINPNGDETTAMADVNARIFNIDAAGISADIEQLVLTGGNPAGGGGAIRTSDGAAVNLIGGTVAGNTAGTDGGGIHASGATVELSGTTLTGNSAYSAGGGLAATSSASVAFTDVTVSGNTAGSHGGGLYGYESSEVRVTSSTVSGNSAAQRGGGLYGYNGVHFVVTNTTLSGNSADDDGGGIHVYNAAVTLLNSTLSTNSAGGDGGGIHVDYAGTATLTNTIVANSTTGQDCARGASAEVAAGDDNIIEDDGCATSAITGVDPSLLPLAYNGGPTFTHALIPGSPAIDPVTGDNTDCGAGTSVVADQRGKGRLDGACDIGAFEFRKLEMGDAPDGVGTPPNTYPTLTENDGARHDAVGVGLRFGSVRDSETDGLASAAADGDDVNGINDEDGVTFDDDLVTEAPATVNTPVTINVSENGRLDAWIDFNADGDWDDAGEQVFIDEAVNADDNFLSFSTPLDAAVGDTFARFRVSETGGLAPTGYADTGEVEDYLVTILDFDTDDDGMSDEYENAHPALDPNDSDDADDDDDGDTLDNLGEFNAGSDPEDPDSDDDGIGDAFDNDSSSMSNECLTDPATLAVLNVPNGTILQCAAETSITVEAGVTIQSGGRLELISPLVTFGDDFSVPTGGELTVKSTDPTPP